MCKCVWQRGGIYTGTCPQSQEESNKFPSAGVTGGRELPNVSTGNRTWDSSVRAVCILNHWDPSPASFSGIHCYALKDQGASVYVRAGVDVYMSAPSWILHLQTNKLPVGILNKKPFSLDRDVAVLMKTFVHVCLCIWLLTCVHMYLDVCACVCVHTRVHVSAHMFLCAFVNLWVCVWIHVCIRICRYASWWQGTCLCEWKQAAGQMCILWNSAQEFLLLCCYGGLPYKVKPNGSQGEPIRQAKVQCSLDLCILEHNSPRMPMLPYYTMQASLAQFLM